MSSPSNSPQNPVTAEEVQDWLHAAQIQRLNLYEAAKEYAHDHQHPPGAARRCRGRFSAC
jgi:hypothetical protein